jgi:hypothetical protein
MTDTARPDTVPAALTECPHGNVTAECGSWTTCGPAAETPAAETPAAETPAAPLTFAAWLEGQAAAAPASPDGDAPGTVHLTLTGANAGTAICAATRWELPAWGALPLPDGHRGSHLAYAPESLVDGTDPRACRECVAAFAVALADDGADGTAHAYA